LHPEGREKMEKEERCCELRRFLLSLLLRSGSMDACPLSRTIAIPMLPKPFYPASGV